MYPSARLQAALRRRRGGGEFPAGGRLAARTTYYSFPHSRVVPACVRLCLCSAVYLLDSSALRTAAVVSVVFP